MIEILVALSLAGILIAGAFQIHAVFNVQSMRQKQVDDMQQSLRIAMQTIERTIRASGSGMMNGRMQITPGCGGALDLFRVQYYNGPTTAMSWVPPVNNPANVASFDTAQGNFSSNPDVLRVITSVSEGSTLAAPAPLATTATILSPTTLLNVFLPGDLLLFVNGNAATSTTSIGCLRQLTAVSASTASGNNFSTAVTYNGGSLCMNSDACVTTIAASTPVRLFRKETYFRILPPAFATDTPKLSVAVVPIGTVLTPSTPWSMITDDIEDMQIALVMNDGRVCNDHDEPYPLYSTIFATAPATLPTAFVSCDPSQATAVRVTLTARTNTLSQGSTSQQSYLGGYEDYQPSVLATDGRLRRSLTSEMTLRN